MMVKRRNPGISALGIALVIGLIVMGCLLSWVTGVSYARQFRSSEASRLTELTKVLATQLDVNQIQRLDESSIRTSPFYNEQTLRLVKLTELVTGLAECYTLKFSDDGARVVIDSGRKGEIGSQTDVVRERYTPFEEVSPVPSEALMAIISGSAQTDSDSQNLAGPSLRRAYYPLADTTGRNVAVLVAAYVSPETSELVLRGMASTLPSLITIFAVLGFMAWAIHRGFQKSSETGSMIRMDSRSRLLRWIIVDVVIFVLAFLCLGVAKNAFTLQDGVLSSLITSESRIAQMERAVMEGRYSQLLAHQASQESASQAELKSQLRSINQTVLFTFLVIAVLSIAALITIRVAMRAHLRLREAQEEANWHRSQHEQIVNGLPIGFYATEAGHLTFTNGSMDVLTERRASEDVHIAFVNSLHPEDRENLLTILKNSEETGESFDCTFRLGDEDSETRYVETHGVPIFDHEGSSNRMVAFAMDVTSRVRAQNLAERRQREAEEANKMLRKALEDGETNFEATVYALVKAVEAKDVYTAGHSERVMDYSVRIGRMMGLSDTQLRTLRMGTLIHDVGKIGIPDSILTKPDRLTAEEFSMVRQHPEIGVRMIEGIPAFGDCIPIVLYHHERLDGRGYPYGLTAENIPLLVRISSVADCFDAMTSDRAYRKGRSPEQALGELVLDAEKGSLDGKIVSILADIVLNGDVSHLQRAA